VVVVVVLLPTGPATATDTVASLTFWSQCSTAGVLSTVLGTYLPTLPTYLTVAGRWSLIAAIVTDCYGQSTAPAKQLQSLGRSCSLLLLFTLLQARPDRCFPFQF
jgi:hypothetical protein